VVGAAGAFISFSPEDINVCALVFAGHHRSAQLRARIANTGNWSRNDIGCVSRDNGSLFPLTPAHTP
jgi:hypothetical protein